MNFNKRAGSTLSNGNHLQRLPASRHFVKVPDWLAVCSGIIAGLEGVCLVERRLDTVYEKARLAML